MLGTLNCVLKLLNQNALCMKNFFLPSQLLTCLVEPLWCIVVIIGFGAFFPSVIWVVSFIYLFIFSEKWGRMSEACIAFAGEFFSIIRPLNVVLSSLIIQA